MSCDRGYRHVRTSAAAVAAFVLSSLSLNAGALGAVQMSESVGGSPTFSRDVAPILQRSCQSCHRPGGLGPMSLMTYDEVRPWAPVVRVRVEERIMPPWHLDRTVGIQQYKNDISLTDDEIATIVAWVEGGAPEGNGGDLPPPVEFPREDIWQLGETLGPPDLVVRSTGYTSATVGYSDQWWSDEVPFEGIPEDRWIRAAEFKPSFPTGVKTVHHGFVNFSQVGGASTQLAEYGIGKRWWIFPENVGMRLPAGEASINWSLHYAPRGMKLEDEYVEFGLWFYPKGEEPSVETAGEVRFRADGMPERPRGQDLLIPPHGYQVLQGIEVLESAAVIHSFRPHMHLRGREMTMEALYPDGRREVLSRVDRFDQNWQISYQYADSVEPLLPKGTMVILTAVFDNTENNPNNPAPDVWVVRGQRGVDDMSHAWIGITYLDDEEFQRRVEERRAQDVAGVLNN